uniref:Sodium-and chloride-dependent GABA transporter ine n=1 Tax=Schistocephalus solidus TaxID=70667 RepID=A0A0X3NWC1_SCHSO
MPEETKRGCVGRPQSSAIDGSVNIICSQSIVERDDPSDSREFMSSSVYNDFDSDIGTLKSVAVDGGEKSFSFSGGLILSCLGCVLGTGNIWRFPRVLASTSSAGGSLTFILAWVFFSIHMVDSTGHYGVHNGTIYKRLSPYFLLQVSRSKIYMGWSLGDSCGIFHQRLLFRGGGLVFLLFLPSLRSTGTARISNGKCRNIPLVYCECLI